MRRTLTLVAAVTLFLGVTACGGDDSGGDFYDILRGCEEELAESDPTMSGVNDEDYRPSFGAFVVGDGGDSLIIDTNNSGPDITVLSCVLSETDASQALTANVDATTAMMGRQQQDDGDYHYSWSYHPDSGIQMTISTK